MSVNCGLTKYSGKPLYSFLTWEDFESVKIVGVMLISFSCIYFLLCQIDEMIKDTSPTTNKDLREKQKKDN